MKLYKNDDIYVRPFTKDDMREPYFNWFYDAKVTKFNSHGLFPYSDKQKEDFIKSLDTNIVWAIMALINSGSITHNNYNCVYCLCHKNKNIRIVLIQSFNFIT